jgi:coenzyme F420-dependent glucose-6-phosphate dehydrogenase
MGRDDGEAWKALGLIRGLRVDGRARAVDPQDLREEADRIGRQEVLGQFARAWDAAELIQAYGPLVEDLEADYIALQVASLDPMARYGSWPPRSSQLS